MYIHEIYCALVFWAIHVHVQYLHAGNFNTVCILPFGKIFWQTYIDLMIHIRDECYLFYFLYSVRLDALLPTNIKYNDSFLPA